MLSDLKHRSQYIMQHISFVLCSYIMAEIVALTGILKLDFFTSYFLLHISKMRVRKLCRAVDKPAWRVVVRR